MLNPTPTSRARRRTRPIAIVVAGAVAASALALAVPATAQADGPATPSNITDASLDWGFNGYSTNAFQFTLGALAGNAAPNPALGNLGFTLSKGQGWLDSSRSGEIDFSGSVTIDYGHAGPGTFVFSNFVLDIADGTTGTLAADISSTYTDRTLTVPTDAADVVIASFGITSLDVTNGSLALQTAAPAWDGVTVTPPTGASAQNTTNAGWGAWPQTFISVLSKSVAPFFYSTSSGGYDLKRAVAMSATGTLAIPSVSVATTYPSAGGIQVAVTGSGFAALNSGLYAGIGPVGLDLTRTSDPAYAANFLTAAWVTTSAIGAGGTFSTALTVPASALSGTGSYSVYTWNAHSHATTASDSITALPFDFGSLVAASTTTVASSATKVAYGKAITLTAKVGTGTTGSVAFTVDGKKLGTATVTSGVASIRTNARALVGKHVVVASYSGDAKHSASSATSSYSVSKDPSTVSVSGKAYAAKHAPVVTVKLGALPTAERAGGKVEITVNGKVYRTVTVSVKKASASVALPKSFGSKGSIRVQAHYLGSSKSAAALSKTVVLRVKR